MIAIRDSASFRDPSGHVFHRDGRVFRTVTNEAAPHYEILRDSGRLQEWSARGWLIDTKEVVPDILAADSAGARYVLEHARVPFVSYPYEWPFAALKAAALRHLDLQIDALEHGIQLSDATAYNVQFVGPRAIFIDALSFRRYQPGDYWLGYRQFCRQFLNPLLLRALVGIVPNAWYRGSLEGISAAELDAVLPYRRRLSWRVFTHVTMQARLERSADRTAPPASSRRPLPKASHAALLAQLRRWIDDLEPAAGPSTWGDYESHQIYDGQEQQRKRDVVRDFMTSAAPEMVWDIGCNTGAYAEVALQSGARAVIGFDSDPVAIETAFMRAVRGNLAFLPLAIDAANPSPEQGWAQHERRGLAGRGPADAVVALAFVHHLAIGRNVPLGHAAAWLTSLAPRGIVEFVQKSDPTIQRMLASREDVFAEYSEASFTAALSRHARIVRSEAVSSTGRRLFVYDRS